MRRIMVAMILGVLIAVIPAGAASAHTHVDPPNSHCIDVLPTHGIDNSFTGNIDIVIHITRQDGDAASGKWCY